MKITLDRKHKRKALLIRAVPVICIVLFVIVLARFNIPKGLKEIVFGNPNIPKDFGKTESLDIAFFDVGQGDSCIIGCEDEYILIDTGDNSQGYNILRYLDKLKVKNIDVMILTHPHSDHIGGADIILNDFNVKSVYMADVVSATTSFESVIDSIRDNEIDTIIPFEGEIITFKGMEIIFLNKSPTEETENLNNTSIVIKVYNDYGSAIFTGDAEAESEEYILTQGYDLEADLLKVGHHGSSTSTTKEFLAEINPHYAVISCGEFNEFGHPHEEVLQLLDMQNIETYITNLDGNIYFSFGVDEVLVTTQQ